MTSEIDNTNIKQSLSDQVLERLRCFLAIHNPKFRIVFKLLPVFLLLLLLVDWLIGYGSFSRDTFRLTGVVTIVILLFALNQLFERVPKVFESIWNRDLIEQKDDESVALRFLAFLDSFENMLNGRTAWILGAICALGGLFATYPVQFYLKAGKFPFDFVTMISYYLWGHGSIIAGVLGYFVGILIWRVIGIAIYLRKLGNEFNLRIQPNHPDKCGGLKPLGDLSLIIGVMILIPSIYLAIWAFITTFFPNPELELYITLWSDLFRQWLVILSILAIFAFLVPIYEIHMQMVNYAEKLRVELDYLSKEIDSITVELRTKAHALTLHDGEEKLKAIEFMKKVYIENNNIPTWPFDWKTLLQFTSAQAIPFLSLIGTSGPFVEIIKTTLSALSK